MMIQDKLNFSLKINQEDSASAASTQQDSARNTSERQEGKSRKQAAAYYHSDQSVDSDSLDESAGNMMVFTPKASQKTEKTMGLDSAFWDQVRAQREARQA